MPWEVAFHEEFAQEFEELRADVQDEILALARLLEEFGPSLSRPHCDTLKGSKHANMKELRFLSLMENGGSPLPLIPYAARSCWSEETNRAFLNSGFTGS